MDRETNDGNPENSDHEENNPSADRANVQEGPMEERNVDDDAESYSCSKNFPDPSGQIPSADVSPPENVMNLDLQVGPSGSGDVLTLSKLNLDAHIRKDKQPHTMASDRKILNLKFNQDQGCFSCCMESGLRIYNVEPLCEKAQYDIETVGSVSQCEMIYRTNLIGMVSGGSRPKFADNVLLIYDDSIKKFILEITFDSSIIAFRLRRDKMVVALLNKIHVFAFPTPTQNLFSIKTRQNSRGLLEITPLANCDKPVLIFPGRKTGSLQIVDLVNTKPGNSPTICIQAHQTDLSCIALNQQGTKIATASLQGTLIRVWETATRNQVVELRRGSDPATIFSINFSQTSEYLCCSSDKGTVHIFAIEKTNLNKRMSVPNILGKYGESQWAFANFTVPPECACVCAFGKKKSVIAIGMDGTFHQYGFKLDGTCVRKTYDIFLDVCNDDIVL